MKYDILVVEDDPHTADLVRLYLERERYVVRVVHDGRQALKAARQRRPDLILLDLMLPEVDGLDVCRVLQIASAVPVIMVTARTTEADKLAGLDVGADDYVTKPFSPRELMARVRAVLRRVVGDPNSPRELRHGDLLVDQLRHEVYRGAVRVSLTPTEFALLALLASAPRRVFTRAQLLDRACGSGYAGMERTVDAHIANLRRKLEPDPAHPRYVLTVQGVGYKLGDSRDSSTAAQAQEHRVG